MDRLPVTSLLVVSPHLDDAVFSCGALIAAHPGAVVVTVFAGLPQPDHPLPEWDATCGFSSAREAVGARRREDRDALIQLEARPCWLGCCDSQYRRSGETPAVARQLSGALRRHRARTVAVPLGLFHSDHQITHEAARSLLRPSHGERWIAYEDALYRRIPGLVAGRLAELERAGYGVSPHDAACDARAAWRKRSAVACYASQLRGLASAGRPGHADLAAPERYWRLSP